MVRIIESLAEIAADYDVLLVDLWGCLHDGVRVFPEAAAALKGFRQGGGTVVLITNAPRPRPDVIAQLDGLGAPREVYDEVVTSGDSAQAALCAGAVGRRVYHIGAARDDSFFTGMAEDLDASAITRVPLEEAEGIVCTGLADDENETPEDFRGPLLYGKQKRLKLLCANPDLFVHRGERKVWCAGAIAALYTEMGGTSLYFGKPHPPIYDLVRRRLGALGVADDAAVLAIGDGPATDMAGAAGEGLDFLFVTGGVAREETGTAPGVAPDPQRLEAYLSDLQQSPAYAIAALR